MKNKNIMDKLLSDNNLYRKQITAVLNQKFHNFSLKGPNSLIRAISSSLYFTSVYEKQITQMLIQFLKKLLAINQVPPNLNILETNQALQQDYCSHPHFPGFDKINIELISMMFHVKINLYFIGEDDKLTVKITNNNYKRMIQLCKFDDHYDSVFNSCFIQHANDVQQILYESIGSSLQYQYKIPKQFKNIEYEIWIYLSYKKEKLQEEIMKIKDKDPYRINLIMIRRNQIKFIRAQRPSLSICLIYKRKNKKYNNQIYWRKIRLKIKCRKYPMRSESLVQNHREKDKKYNQIKRNNYYRMNQNKYLIQEIIHQVYIFKFSNKILNKGITLQNINSINNGQLTETPIKHIVLDESLQRFTGRLKFFDEQKNYGFIVSDNDNSDIFVHYDDLNKAGITKEFIRDLGGGYRSITQVNHFSTGSNAPRLSFVLMTYMGKYNKSKKAIELKVLID